MLKFPQLTNVDKYSIQTSHGVLKIVDRIEQNLDLLAFYRCTDNALAKYNLVNGVADGYQNQAGIDEDESSGYVYVAEDRYFAPFINTLYRPSDISTGLQGYWKLQEPSSHTFAYHGNAQLDTGVTPKFGTASLLLDGTGDDIYTANRAEFNLYDQDFTFDFWARWSTLTWSANQFLLDYRIDSGNEVQCSFYDAGTGDYRFRVLIDNAAEYGGGLFDYRPVISPTVDTWHHFAWVRSGQTSYVFQDGTLLGTQTTVLSSWKNAPSSASAAFYIGSRSNIELFFNGWIDEFRFSRIARWTESFTPEVAQYTNDEHTILLMHFDGSDASTTFTDSMDGTRFDSSLNGNDLADNASVLVQAQDYWNGIGILSADFETGSSEYLSITDASQTGLDISGAGGSVTMVAWVRSESLTNYRSIIAKYNNSNAGYSMKIDASGNLVFDVNASRYSSSGSTMGVGQWYHVAIVFDEPNNLILFYLGGNLITATGSATFTITDVASDFNVGAADSGAANYFDGLIKDAAVWNTVLTPIQIKSLAYGVDYSKYAYRPDSVSTQPDSWWKLNEISPGTGAVSREDSSGSNTLTDINTTASKRGYAEGVGAFFVVANTERLTAADNTILHPGDVDCSWSAWVRLTALSLTQPIMSVWDSGSNQRSFLFYVDNTNHLAIGMSANGTAVAGQAVSVNTLSSGVWYHCAAIYNSTTDQLKIYLDGRLEHQVTSVGGMFAASTALFTIGASYSSGSPSTWLGGSIQDSAMWSGYELSESEIQNLASAFPIQKTGIISYWKMDESRAAHTLVASGSTQVDTLYQKFGTGSCLFQSSGSSFLTITDSGGHPDFALGTGDFTVEFWARFIASPGNEGFFGETGDSTGMRAWYEHSGSQLSLGGSAQVNFTSWQVSDTNFHHIAFVRKNGMASCYVDGTQIGTTQAWTVDATYTADMRFGARNAAIMYMDGRMDEIRVSTIARYLADFTPATAAFTTDQYTALLLHCDGIDTSTDFPDSSVVRYPHTMTAVGTAQVDTTYKKFGTGSLLQTATGAALTTPASDDFNINIGDWTIDFWVRFTDYTASNYFCGQRETDPVKAWYISKYADGGDDSNKLRYSCTGGTGVYHGTYEMASTWSPANNTWYHLAFVRSGSTAYIFIDGVSQSVYQERAFNSTEVTRDALMKVAGYHTLTTSLVGGMDEFRISKGIARWTSDFTPSTTFYEDDAYTVLLLHMDGVDASTRFPDSVSGIPTTYADSIGVNDLTTVNSPIQVIGQAGNAADFESGSTQLAYNSNSAFEIKSDQLSMMCWFKMESSGSAMCIMGHHDNSAEGFAWLHTSAHVFRVDFQGSNHTATMTALTDGKWYHGCVTWDKYAVNFYVDGGWVYSVAQSGTLTWDSTVDFTLGVQRYPNSPTAYFDGLQDEALVASRYFRPQEIKSVYIKGLINRTLESPNVYQNMSLVSSIGTAVSEPKHMRLVIHEDDVDSITPNTDILGYVSRDGGTTFEQVTLEDAGYYDGTKRILSGVATVLNQPSGTSPVYKIETANEKDLKIYGAELNWE